MMRKEGGSDTVRNNHSNKRTIGILGTAAAIMIAGLAGMQGFSVAAAPGDSGSIHSKGSVRYDQAVIDSADLHDIHEHITEKKDMLAGILIQLGTKFRQQSEGCTYDRNPDAEQGDIDKRQLNWSTLVQAAEESQNVPAGLAVLNPEAAMYIEGVEERTDYYETAIEDNISRGKAAWAEGRLLLGNGADNDKAYRKGIEDGEEGDVPDHLYPIYGAEEAAVEIRHVHLGKAENKDGTSGCYRNSHTTKEEVKTCSQQLIETDRVWYPNPDEPGGGSWHGGEYTCPNHGGLYDSPGTCTYKRTETVTVWKHDIVCGLTDMLYARLTVRGTDTDYFDRAIRLEAVLEEGEGYENLTWQEGDELVWTDADGNALGIGPELIAHETGVYRCSINAANADIDHREASTAVRKIGIVMSGN